MLERLRKLFSRQHPAAPSEVALEWVGAYVRPTEIADRWQVAGRADLLVARLLGSVAIAVDANTNACCSTRLRLYRKATKKKNAVGGKRAKWLRGELEDRPDHKSVAYAQDMGDVEEVTEGPVLDFMHRPNPWWNGADWQYLRFKAREATGNAYSFIEVDGKTAEAYWLPPQCVRVVASADEPIALYRFSRNLTHWFDSEPEYVFHSMLRPSLQDSRLGETWIHGILKYLDVLEGAHDAEYARQKNGSRPDYVVELPPSTTKEARDKFRSELQNMHRGPAQSGRPIVGTAGMVIKPLGFTPKDIEAKELFAYYDGMIQRAASMPESISKLNDASRANAGAGLVQYMRYMALPRQSRDAAELTDAILPRFGLTPGEYFFAYDNPVPEDDLAEEQSRVLRVGAGILTIDEARAEEGLEPLPDGLGAVARVNGQPLQSAEQLQAAADAQLESMRSRNDQKPTDKTEPTEAEKAVRAKARAFLAPEHGHEHGTKDFKLPPELERQMEGLSADVREWLNKLAQHCPVAPDGTVDLTKFREELGKALDARLYSAIHRGAADGLQDAGSTASLSAQQFLIAAFLETYSFATSAEITETTKTAIETTIARLIEQGASREEAVSAMRAALPDVSDARARTIAQTEMSRVYGMGNVVGWVRAGAGWKEWKLASNPCPLCEELVAELRLKSMTLAGLPARLRGRPVVEVSEPFTETDYGPVYSHPLHPNCYCDVLFVNELTELTPDEANSRTNKLIAEMKDAFDTLGE